MKNSFEVLIITQKDIIDAVGLDCKLAAKIAEQAMNGYSKGSVLYPDKVSQIFDEASQNRTNCLPATILDKKVSGMKWVSVFPTNAAIGLDNLSASVLLSSTENGFPLAFMDGTICSNLRTAAVSTVAAKYLSKANPETIGFVGAGQQARFHLLSLKEQFPSIKKCFVASRTEKSEQSFVEDMTGLCKNVELIPCHTSFQKAVSDADVVVSAISGQAPVIKADWIKKGMLYLHVGGWEDEYEVPLKADKIVCDCWNSVKHRTQTLSRLYKMGKLSDEDIYADLPELVSGMKSRRENDSEFIYFNAVGLSYVDISLAYEIYEMCKEKGLGQSIEMQSDNIFKVIKKEGDKLC